MPKDFIPASDDLLLSWSGALSNAISADPSAYGTTSFIAARYSLVRAEFAEALVAARAVATRGPRCVGIKNAARKRLVAESRAVARIAQAVPTLNDIQRVVAALPVRKGRGSPVGPPDEAPHVAVELVDGRTVRVRLQRALFAGRARPPGASGAAIFSCVAEQWPARRDAWDVVCHTNRTTVKFTFGPDVPAGSRVWVCAYWLSPRSGRSPTGRPAMTYLAGGDVNFAAPGMFAAA